MFKNKLLLLQNNLEDIVRRPRYVSTPGGTIHLGSTILSNIFTLDRSGNLSFSGIGAGNISLGINLVGSQLFAGNTTVASSLDLFGTAARTITSPSLLQNGLDLSSTASRTITSSSLLQNDFDLSLSGSRLIGSDGIIRNTYNVLSVPALTISGGETAELIFIFSGEYDILGQKLGDINLVNNLDLSATGSLILSAANNPNLIFTLFGDGIDEAGAVKDSDAILSTILSLVSSGSIVFAGNSDIQNIYSINSLGNLNISSSHVISNIYGINSVGSLTMTGQIGPRLIFDLTGDATTTSEQLGDAALLLSSLLYSRGSILYGGSSNFPQQIFTTDPIGNLDIAGFNNFGNQYELSGVLSGLVTGRFSGGLDIDLESLLTSDSETIVSALFILNLLQSKTFNLKVDRSKMFSLKI